MIITVSERGEYKRCRRRWDLGSWNRQSLQRIAPKPALSLGRLVHAALADWTLDPAGDLSDMYMHHAVKDYNDMRETYRKQVGAPMSDEEIGPTLDAIELGRHMMANYQTFHKTPLPQEFEGVAPEQMCVVPIPGTEHECPKCEGHGWIYGHETCQACHGTGVEYHYLEGKLDALVKDKRGRIYVLERKTYGQRPRLETLNSNDQFLAYMWILTQLDIGPVGGIAYDGMWKRDGSRHPIEELFLRTLLTRPRLELDEFEHHLALEANEIASNPPLYINRRWEGCYDCDFEPLCLAMSRGEDVDYVRQHMYTLRPKDPVLFEAELASEELVVL